MHTLIGTQHIVVWKMSVGLTYLYYKQRMLRKFLLRLAFPKNIRY